MCNDCISVVQLIESKGCSELSMYCPSFPPPTDLLCQFIVQTSICADIVSWFGNYTTQSICQTLGFCSCGACNCGYCKKKKFLFLFFFWFFFFQVPDLHMVVVWVFPITALLLLMEPQKQTFLLSKKSNLKRWLSTLTSKHHQITFVLMELVLQDMKGVVILVFENKLKWKKKNCVKNLNLF